MLFLCNRLWASTNRSYLAWIWWFACWLYQRKKQVGNLPFLGLTGDTASRGGWLRTRTRWERTRWRNRAADVGLPVLFQIRWWIVLQTIGSTATCIPCEATQTLFLRAWPLSQGCPYGGRRRQTLHIEAFQLCLFHESPGTFFQIPFLSGTTLNPFPTPFPVSFFSLLKTLLNITDNS